MAKAKKKKQTVGKKDALHLARGQQLSKYRLIKRVGTGGFCEVWKARDTVEGIWVALKVPQLDNGKRDNQSVLKEVGLIAKLRHQNIMPVKNADIINGYAVMATELSEGTLADKSKPMGLRRILSIICQVLEGLAYAQHHRVVHCDVTPGNIFLLKGGRAALGDFGISMEFKGRMFTIEEFGTPGYVAPEQAYGRPSYRSDCFAVGLILYEYITGYLPRWPFRWPFRGAERLRERTNGSFVRFMRQCLTVDTSRRFANAEQMLSSLLQAVPKNLHKEITKISTAKKRMDWQQMRREAFVKRYGKVLPASLSCHKCGEPISESMAICPWCGSGQNKFDYRSRFSHVCRRCHKGVLPEWRYCPWCYGAGFKSPSSLRTAGVRYQGHCRYCKGQLMRFMRYCPWCRRKVRQTWQVKPFPEICGRCGWSVDSEFWNYCPWCKQNLGPG